MEGQIWERILVDWVNVLKLSKPIQNLEDLKDGVFFSNLQKVIKKSSEVESDVLTCLFEILNHHYPKFAIENKSKVHLTDVPIQDLFAITSLLMHYTCIHDRRDVLTSPLCHNLQQTTQICIKNFLEQVQLCSELTNEMLRQIIDNCMKDMENITSNKSQLWLSFPSSTEMNQSPLELILKTPTSKSSRLLEKDKEIARLKINLEVVQEEKENLEEDLQKQIEKHKKLGKQLAQKATEISRLRSEVVSLENRTPPHYQDTGFRETQKILRTRIESLEQIIEQCDKENQELREQRDAEKMQVKKLEAQCKTWLEKFIDSDNKLQILTEHSTEQETKYANLRSHCSELELLLEELKPKTNNESFTEESFRSVNSNRRSKNSETMPSCEDLAHSVVDVQLKEQQKENEELKLALQEAAAVRDSMKQSIDSFIEETNLLTVKRGKLESKLEEQEEEVKRLKYELENSIMNHKQTRNDLTESVKHCNSLQEDITKLLHEKESIMQENHKVEKELHENKCKITTLNLKLEDLTKEMQNTICQKNIVIEENKEVVEKLTTSCQILNLDLEQLKEKLELRKSEIIILTSERDEIMKEKNCFEKALSKTEEQVRRLGLNLEKTRTAFDELSSKHKLLDSEKEKISLNYTQTSIELEKIKSEKIIVEQELSKSMSNREAISQEKEIVEKELKEISGKLETVILERNELHETLKCVTARNNELQKNLHVLSEEKIITNQEICRNSAELREVMSEKEKLSIQLFNVSSEKDLLITEVANTKLDNSKLLRDAEDLSTENKILSHALENITRDFNLANSEKQAFSEKLDNISEQLEKALSENKHFSEISCELSHNWQKEICRNQEISQELIAVEEQSKVSRSELKKLSVTLRDISSELQDNFREKELLSESVQKLTGELEQANAENKRLLHKLDDVTEQLNKSNSEKQQLSDKYQRIFCEKQNICDELNKYQGENEKLLVRVTEFSEKIQEITRNNEKLLLENEKISANLRIVEKDNGSLKIEIHQLQETNNELKVFSIELKSKNEEVLNTLETIANENHEISHTLALKQTEFQNSLEKINQIAQKLERTEKEVENLTQINKSLSDQLAENVSEKLGLLEAMTLRDTTIENLENLKDKLLEENNDFCNKLKQAEEGYNHTLQEKKEIAKKLNTMSVELNKGLSELAESENQNEFLRQQIIQFEEKIQAAHGNIRELDKHLSKVINDLDNAIGNNNILLEDKHKLEQAAEVNKTNLKRCEEEHEETKKKLDILSSELNRILAELSENKKLKELLIEERSQLEDKLKEDNEKIGNLNKELTKVTNDLNNIISSNTNLIEDKQKLELVVELYKNDMKKYQKENEENQDKLITVSSELNKLSLELSDSKKQIELLAQVRNQLEGQLQVDNENIRNLKEQLMETTNDLNDVVLKNNGFIEEKQKLALTIKDYENKLTEQHKEIHEHLSEQTALINNAKVVSIELKECMSKNERFSEIIEQLSDDLRLSKSENEKLVIEISAVTTNKNNLETRCQALSEDIKILENRDKENLENLNKISKDLENELFQKSQLSENLKLAIQEKDIMMLKLSTTELELNNLLSEKSSLSDKLEEVVRANSEYSDKIVQISSEKCRISEELDKTLSDNRLFSDRLIKMSEDFGKTSEKLTEENKLLFESLQNEIRKNNVIFCKIDEICEKVASNRDEIFRILQNSKEDNFVEEQIMKSTDIEEDENSTDLVSNKYGVCENFAKVILEDKKLLGELWKLQNLQVNNEKLVKSLNTFSMEYISRVNTLTKEKNNLTDKIGLIMDEKKGFVDKFEAAEKVISELKKDLEKVTEEKSVFSNFLDLNNSELQKVLEEKDKILEALEMSNKEVEQIAEEKQSLLEQIASISEQKSHLLDIQESSNKKIEILNEEKQSLLKQVAELGEKLAKMTEDHINISKHFERISQEKAEFSEQLDKVSQEKVDISEKLQLIVDQSYIASDLLKKVDNLTDENVRLLGQATSLSNDLEAKLKEVNLLELSNKRLKKLVEEKSNILARVSDENRDIFEVVDRLSQEKSEMSQSIELTLKELEKRSEEKNRLKQTVDSLTKNLENVSHRNQMLINSLEMSKKELHKVKCERNDLLETQTKIMKETENDILLAHEEAVELKNDLLKRVELAETEKLSMKKQYEQDLRKIREAYANVVSKNSKYELENVNLSKKVEDKNLQLAEYTQVKEAYEKLLEENNKLMTEVDTVKYKRSRDREEFVNMLKKERDDADARENRRVRDVRNEYEVKLEKMKEKMLKLYREEVNKEMQKVKAGQNESGILQKTIEDLTNQLFEAKQKIHIFEIECEMLRIKETQSQRHSILSMQSLHTVRDKESHHSVRDSITSVKSLGSELGLRQNSDQLTRKVHSVSSFNPPNEKEYFRNKFERKVSTLPKSQVAEVEETVTISRRTSINSMPANIGNLEMEDEDDDFNNKYLADLKAGKCITATGRESNVNRFSELAWRNSLVPPHLKSSYPAEMQFVSPGHYKEEDIKTGNVELDDSLCRLLPGEKPRQKKDFGTTTYKKPGPPTPSKNGGRLSLQGNEVQPLRDHNERTPKKSTPSRIRALFMGRPNQKENSEVLVAECFDQITDPCRLVARNHCPHSSGICLCSTITKELLKIHLNNLSENYMGCSFGNTCCAKAFIIDKVWCCAKNFSCFLLLSYAIKLCLNALKITSTLLPRRG